jgi:restriction system protein
MTVWLVRAGKNGERQDFALDNNVAVVGWTEVGDLSVVSSKEDLKSLLGSAYESKSKRAIANWTSQLYSFSRTIQKDDIIILPLKGQDAIAMGIATGLYKYQTNNPDGAKHTIPVKWVKPDVPRSAFDQDLLYSFGAFLTVCQISRNNAGERILALLNGELVETKPALEVADTSSDSEDNFIPPNIEDYSYTQIKEHIGQKFKGHALADLVGSVLKAQGYQMEISPPGPDGGVDIIAGRGPLGFDPPRLVVQVKSGGQEDVKTLRELTGVMQDFRADQGLLVSWGGFKRSVISEVKRRFFEIRIWDAGDLLDAVMKHYDQLPEDIRTELPLKRIWTLVQED